MTSTDAFSDYFINVYRSTIVIMCESRSKTEQLFLFNYICLKEYKFMREVEMHLLKKIY